MCILYACFIPVLCIPLLGHVLILSATIVKCIFAASVQSQPINSFDITSRGPA